MRWTTGLFLSAVMTSGAQAGTYLYEVESFPKDRGPCIEAARAVAAEVESQVPGVAVVKAACLDVTSHGFKLGVTLEGETIPPLVTTEERPRFARTGAYESLEACRADLSGEADHFARRTGLTPVTAYCFESRSPTPYPYGMKIDAFGEAAAQPVAGHLPIFGSPDDMDDAAFAAAFASRLEARGVDVRHAVFLSSGIEELHVLYYATSPLSFEKLSLVETRTLAECREQLSSARGLLADGFPQVLLTFCSGRDLLDRYEVLTLGLAPLGIDARRDATWFGSRAACEAERRAIQASLETQYGRAALGSFCTSPVGSWDDYRVQVIFAD